MLHARALSLERGEKTEEGGVNGDSYERAKAINKKKRSEKIYKKRENHKRLKVTLEIRIQARTVESGSCGHQRKKIWLY